MKRIASLALLLLACGTRTSPGLNADGGRFDPDAGSGAKDTVSGTVWAPGNAPGMVPPGQEIPVYNALVYVSLQKPDPIPQEVYCEACTAAPSNAVTTDHKGNFTLDHVATGKKFWLVIQKGQFRLEQQITTSADTRMLPATMTTLPSETNPANGTWIPKIALASGSYDAMQEILGKAGLGEVDASGAFQASSAAGHFDIYKNGGALDGSTPDTLTDLVSSLDRMKQYHIIFIPCAGSSNDPALMSQQNLKNMRDYVALGGRLYVADWSGEWMDMPFPRELELDGSHDTPGSAYDPITDTWNTSLMGDANGGLYESTAEVTDPDMFQWLDGQIGPDGTFDAANLTVEDNWNIIKKTFSVQIGVDMQGMPVFDNPRVYVIGTNGTYPQRTPLTATFEPAGCGRVLYTTYHTTPGTHVGLKSQERMLLYLLMEIGVCKDGPIVD